MLPMITRRNYKPFLWSSLFDDDFFPVVSARNTSMRQSTSGKMKRDSLSTWQCRG